MLHISMILIPLILLLLFAAISAENCQDVKEFALNGDPEKTCEQISKVPWKRRVSEAFLPQTSYPTRTVLILKHNLLISFV